MSAMGDQAKPRQLPLDLGHQPALSRDDLILSDANAAAVRLVDSWPAWPAPVTVLAGPTGSGKSHIAEVWRQAANAHVADPIAIAARDIDAALRQPILLDDVAGGELDENGLFHVINAVRQSGGHMLLVSRLFPAAWGVRLPDLASRLKAAATVEIGEPDDMLLSAVITKLFADRQIEVEPHVVQFLTRRIERSLSAAIAVVDELDRAALEGKKRITRGLAADVVEKIEREGARP